MDFDWIDLGMALAFGEEMTINEASSIAEELIEQDIDYPQQLRHELDQRNETNIITSLIDLNEDDELLEEYKWAEEQVERILSECING